MGEIRSFIAIELPNDVKSSLAILLNNLKPGNESSVKWVAPGSIHLTLKFLGNIPENKVIDITQAIEKSIKGISSFTLALHQLGGFPNLRSPRVVWVGISGDIEVVTRLQKNIDRAMIPLGFQGEKRGFSPHLTLGRVRDKVTSKEKLELRTRIESQGVKNPSPFSVNEISLMKSTLARSGAIYDRLVTIPLDRI